MALEKILHVEGGCQHHENDSGYWRVQNEVNETTGNWVNVSGIIRIGSTCAGITPGLGLTRRYRELRWCEYSGRVELFVEYCYDRDRSRFKQSAREVRNAMASALLEKRCTDLPQQVLLRVQTFAESSILRMRRHSRQQRCRQK